MTDTAAHTDPTNSEARTLGSLLAALGPLLALTASASAYPLASGGGRLLAGGLDLAPAAGPGYPLASLAVALITRSVPLGPLALRSALATALLFALAAALLYRAIDATLQAKGALRPLLASPLALASTWLAFGLWPLFETQAAPYAGAVALGCAFIERLCAFELAWPRLELRPVRIAAILWGALLFEQPLVAFVLLAPAAPVLMRLVRAYRLPRWNLVLLGAGLPLLVFGVVRAHAGSDPFERPLAGFADAFTLAPTWPALLFERHQGIGVKLLFAATLAGALLGLRARARRRSSALWLLACAAPLAAGSLFAQREALLALALCGAAGAGAGLLSRLVALSPRSRIAALFALACAALGLGQLQRQRDIARAFDPGAMDVIADWARRELAPRSVLLLSPSSHAAFLDAEREERVRPDLVPAPKPWQLRLAGAERVAAHAPALMPLLRADLLAPAISANPPALPLVELQALAATRPVLVELEPQLERSAYDVLLPSGLYHQLATSSVSKADLQLAARDSERRWHRLYALVDLSRLTDPARALLSARLAAAIDHAAALRDASLVQAATARARALSEARASGPPLP